MAAKLVKQKKPKENVGKQISGSFLEYMCALWAIVLSVALPLYMKDGYYQIGTAKYNAYAHIVVFGMPVILLLAVIYIVFSVKEAGISLQGTKQVYKNMSVTDRFVVGYILITLVSFFSCGHMKEAFWGYNGWFMGLFSQLTFVLIYFVFSRFLKDYPVVLSFLCVTAMYVFVVAILHRMLIDTVGTYDNLSDYYKTQFLSTLGQASWYSSFMTTVLPIGMFAYWYFKHYALRVITGIFVFTGFMTLVSQNTDSAYFGFLAAMLVLMHVSVKNAGRMRRLFELALLFFLAPKGMAGLLKLHPNTVMEWDAISAMLMQDGRTWIMVMVCAVMILVFAILERKGKYPVRAMRIVRNVFYVVVLCLVVLWVVILVAGVKGVLPERMAALTTAVPYLQWNIYWGNGRGFTWEFTAKMLSEMSLKDKIIGVGPDCYAIYGHGHYNELIRSKWGDSVLSNAHNEWMNMAVNGGWIGAAAYLGIFVSALVRFVKKSESRPVLLGFAACIAAYMAHNVFCYQQVLCTPFVFLFIALGEYQIRKKEEG
ncbi:MAG: O-antigen ligase family protein [Lachnospiraceae bacterium]|nr:O-antigen ligase family protein [Lachnospiraceae bacterium]